MRLAYHLVGEQHQGPSDSHHIEYLRVGQADNSLELELAKLIS